MFLTHSGTLSTVEYAVFQEWFDYLMTNEKPQIDLIGVYWTFAWLDFSMSMSMVWAKLDCLSEQASWEVCFIKIQEM